MSRIKSTVSFWFELFVFFFWFYKFFTYSLCSVFAHCVSSGSAGFLESSLIFFCYFIALLFAQYQSRIFAFCPQSRDREIVASTKDQVNLCSNMYILNPLGDSELNKILPLIGLHGSFYFGFGSGIRFFCGRKKSQNCL